MNIEACLNTLTQIDQSNEQPPLPLRLRIIAERAANSKTSRTPERKSYILNKARRKNKSFDLLLYEQNIRDIQLHRFSQPLPGQLRFVRVHVSFSLIPFLLPHHFEDPFYFLKITSIRIIIIIIPSEPYRRERLEH